MNESINILSAATPVESDKSAVIQIEHLFKSFGSNKVLNDFSLSVKKGEIVVVLGKSGSGKSVLIKCLIGLLHPDSGLVKVLGHSIPDLNPDELDELRMRVGFLFQSNALYDSMTVRENLEFPLRRHAIAFELEEVNQRVKQALDDVGLSHTLEMMPAELSGGMRKRIALARTLILRPEIILYDEPTTGLDPITAREIIGLMLEIQQKYNATALIISHDMNCVREAADRVVMLIDGRCYAEGSFDELKKSSDKRIREFFE
ncbi:MAG: ABC transporter ATP-binding protein [Chitinophagaceae bacterium]